MSSALTGLDASLDALEGREVGARIWQRDHTVWNSDPREITDRLGWLTVTDTMREQAPALEAFARGVRDEGVRHVVLLGMGGSSLGPEVLRQTFGSAHGYPEMIVLDSTAPDWVRAVGDAIDPARTLFLVSSKSGGTIEPNALYKHFRASVEKATTAKQAGQHFVATTDPGTSLERLAREQGFRRLFLNPPDIGGRYSALSCFGLVPAALMGIDVLLLLDRADRMRERCAASVPARENPGVWLGAAIGALALGGRDKLTLMTSPSIGSFGLWAEQLIAESTGKDGKGVVPVAGEPMLDPSSYGEDRLFVYLHLADDENVEIDAHVERVRALGHPLIQLDLLDQYDLGSDLYRWEFATAVAGAVLGIQPFDQPNVQQTKDLTDAVLQEYLDSGRIEEPQTELSPRELLSGAQHGQYLAIMAYMQPSPETDAAFTELRRRVGERFRIATTLGYGPRFLHSTGQLHKGGPPNGLFLQVTVPRGADVPIPGDPYSFGTLIEAQALGDLRALMGLGRRVAAVRTDDIAAISV